MAALSYHSNWDTFDHQHEFNSDMNIILSPPDHLFNNTYTQFSDNFLNLDHLFEPNDVVLHSQNYDHFQSPQNIYSDMINELLQENHSPEPLIIPTLPYFSTATAAPETGRSLSAQSVAARQRRRRISEKTQQLGKLVPGGMKMNTAEMLNAAYKYVKFLQAQIHILEFMSSYYHEGIYGGLFQSGELEGFLESPLIQKLYSMEKFLVPEKLMQELAANDRDSMLCSK